MSSKGVLNPWVQPAKAQEAEPVAAQLSAKARAGKTPVAFQGRLYTLLVTIPVLLKDSTDAEKAARHMLGELLTHRALFDAMPTLRRQNLSLKEQDILGPRVQMPFGPATLYAAASSSDLALAQAMALDRLALALTEARARVPAVGKVLQEHGLEVLRNV